MKDMSKFTYDSFFNGRIKVMQHKNGYRFSIDAVILADYASKRPAKKVLDLGTGCGIIPLIILWNRPETTVVGVEIQKELAHIARENVKANCLEHKITILRMDMKSLKRDNGEGAFDLIVSNPPYWRPGSGRINPDMQKAVARHEIKASLKDVVAAAKRMSDISSRIAMIYPAERLSALLSQMDKAKIEPKYLRMIHSKKDTEAKLFIIEGVKGGRPGLKIDPPLVIYNKDGSYTSEIRKMFGPRRGHGRSRSFRPVGFRPHPPESQR